MKPIKGLLRSAHIQIALATGASIIIMAYFSKRILAEPIGYLPLAIPPFIATMYEGFLTRYKQRKILTSWYWVVAILAATALVIVAHAL